MLVNLDVGLSAIILTLGTSNDSAPSGVQGQLDYKDIFSGGSDTPTETQWPAPSPVSLGPSQDLDINMDKEVWQQ